MVVDIHSFVSSGTLNLFIHSLISLACIATFRQNPY